MYYIHTHHFHKWFKGFELGTPKWVEIKEQTKAVTLKTAKSLCKKLKGVYGPGIDLQIIKRKEIE